MHQFDPGPEHPTFQVRCGLPSLHKELSQTILGLGWRQAPGARLTLMVDGPWGVVLGMLDARPAGAVVVLTDNPCPEYWQDVWDRGPCALLAGGHTVADIAQALRRVQAGERFRHTPKGESVLTPTERRLLWAMAKTWENKRIAAELKLSPGTVKNGVTRVLDKLGLENRTQAALYYLGIWQFTGPDSPFLRRA